jgi:hypothetical protein
MLQRHRGTPDVARRTCGRRTEAATFILRRSSRAFGCGGLRRGLQHIFSAVADYPFSLACVDSGNGVAMQIKSHGLDAAGPNPENKLGWVDNEAGKAMADFPKYVEDRSIR